MQDGPTVHCLILPPQHLAFNDYPMSGGWEVAPKIKPCHGGPQGSCVFPNLPMSSFQSKHRAEIQAMFAEGVTELSDSEPSSGSKILFFPPYALYFHFYCGNEHMIVHTTCDVQN